MATVSREMERPVCVGATCWLVSVRCVCLQIHNRKYAVAGIQELERDARSYTHIITESFKEETAFACPEHLMCLNELPRS